MPTDFSPFPQDGDTIYAEDINQYAAPINALETAIESKGQPNGLASLDGAGKVPASQLPAAGATSLDALTDVAITSPASGQVLRHNGTEFTNAALGAADMPSGIDAAKIGSGTVSNAELGYLDGVTSSVQTQLNGKAASTHTHVISDVTNLQTSLNAKQDTSAKGAANGYASLDATGKVPSSQLPASGGGGATSLDELSDVVIASPASGQVLRHNGTEFANAALGAADMPSGIDAAKIGSGAVSNAELAYLDGVTSSVQTQLNGKAASSHTHPISDVTNLQTNLNAKQDTSAKNAASGYAGLDASSKLAVSQMSEVMPLNGLSDVSITTPSTGQMVRFNGTTWVNAAPAASDLPSGIDAAKIGSGAVSNAELGYLDGVTSSVQTQLDGKAAASHTHPISDVTNLQTNLDAKEDKSAKGAVNGYASLDSSGKVPAAQLPAGSGVSALTDLSDVTISSPASGQLLKHNGTEFVNGALAAGDMPSGIDAAKIGSGAVSNAEFAYLDGVTSSIQAQLNNKIGGTVPVAQGGTGATTAANARFNLQVPSTSDLSSGLAGKANTNHTHTYAQISGGMMTSARAKVTSMPNSGNGYTVYRMPIPGAGGAEINELVWLSSRSMHKKDVSKIQTSIDDLMLWNPVEFTWKDAFGGERDLGFIANEINEVYPMACLNDRDWNYLDEETGEYQKNEDGSPVMTDEIVPTGVKYDRAWIPMLAAVQDFYQKFQQEQAKSELLEARLAELESALGS